MTLKYNHFTISFQKSTKMIVFKRINRIALISTLLVLTFQVPFSQAASKESSSKTSQISKKSSKTSAKQVSSKRSGSSKTALKAKEPVKPQVARESSSRVSKSAALAAGAVGAGAVTKVAYSASSTDPLNLKSSAVLVADADTKELIYAKNPNAVLPIASITKLMTVVVNLEAKVDLDEKVRITEEDMDSLKGTRSRLAPGSEFTRRELMHLALMASENRAAAALGRTYPGGMQACAKAMNERAKRLGMYNSSFVESTGLSASNQSSPNDLALLVMHANKFPLIQEYSTSPSFQVESRHGRELMFRNTNALIKKDHWDIHVQKTGFINEAGRCLVMQAKVGTRNLVIVLLDSVSKASRFADAERIRKYVIQQ